MGKKNSSPNTKRQERRHASKERRAQRTYKEIRKNKGLKSAAVFKQQRIKAEKERFERDYAEIQTFKRTLSDIRKGNGNKLTDEEIKQTMNKTIRMLYDKGIIKGQFAYYEDFVEQHKNEIDIDEILGLVDEAEKQEEAAHEEILNAIQNPDYGKQFKRRSNGFKVKFS